VVVVGVDGVGVGRRRRRSGGSPRFSAYGIGPSRVCGESCSTAIIGLRASMTSLHLCGAVRRGCTAIHDKHPDQGADEIGFSIPETFSNRRDHIPNRG
jgi:hypothetical protein